jgi:ATP-dependent Clp protease ATP-binding subunit ClpA
MARRNNVVPIDEAEHWLKFIKEFEKGKNNSVASFGRNQLVESQESSSLDSLWNIFSENLIGQEKVKKQFRPFFDELYYLRALGKMPSTTYGAYLLCGPTGVGKGEFARSLAKALHKSENNILTISCGEFSHGHEVSKLLGAPPGYLGHRETVAMLSQPRINAVSSEHADVSIILWDEVEKAHPDVFNALLNILDRAEMRTGDNNKVNFERTVHILTSNLGNTYEKDSKQFLKKEILSEEQRIAKQAAAINKFFKKEFLGRINEVFYFSRFEDEEIDLLLSIFSEKFFMEPCSKLYNKGIVIEKILLSTSAARKIKESANVEEFGARELYYSIRRNIGNLGLNELFTLQSKKSRGSYKLHFEYRKDKFSARLVQEAADDDENY